MDILIETLRKLYPNPNFKKCVIVGSSEEGKGYPNSKIIHLEYPNLDSVTDIDCASFILSDENFYRDAKYILFNMIPGGVMAFFKSTEQTDKLLIEFPDNLELLHKEETVIFKVLKPLTLTFHVYAFNWNEERLLPHFFNYYHQADKIYIMDNQSDDKSCEIAASHDNAVILSFDTGGKLDSYTHRIIENEIWKKSKGRADYVIIQDLDEFLFFKKYPGDLRRALINLKVEGVTICKCIGYNMACTDEYYDKILPDQLLSSTVVRGVFTPFYCKTRCFNPNEIEEMNFNLGAHDCEPRGNLKYPNESPLLLHFRFMGIEYLKSRVKLLGSRVSQRCRDNNLNSHLTDKEEGLIKGTVKDYEGCMAGDNFRIMYPDANIQAVKFNGRMGLIDTLGGLDDFCLATVNNQVWYPSIANFMKELNQENTTLLNFDSSTGYFSVIAKLCGYQEIYTFTDNKITFDKLKNTTKINGWKNFTPVFDEIYFPEIKSEHIVIKVHSEDLEALFDIQDIINSPTTKAVIISLNLENLSMDYLKEILDLLKSYPKILNLIMTREGEENSKEFIPQEVQSEDLIKTLANNYIYASLAFLRFHN